MQPCCIIFNSRVQFSRIQAVLLSLNFLTNLIQSAQNIICHAVYLHKIEYFLMAETPATLNWVEWKKTCIWILKKIWSLLLNPKCVLKGGLNNAEIFTTDTYRLFLHKTAFLLFPLKISAGVPPVRPMTSITSLSALSGPCHAVSTKGDVWGGRPRPLVTVSQQSSAEISSLVLWVQMGHGFAKAFSKSILCP